MPSVKQYMSVLRARQNMIARKLGTDIGRSGKDDRVANLAILALIAVLMKALVDKGLITDAELNAVLVNASDDAYDDEPIEPIEDP